jgi:hypothetical protein
MCKGVKRKNPAFVLRTITMPRKPLDMKPEMSQIVAGKRLAESI